MDEHDAREPYQDYSLHHSLCGKGECYDILCRDAASHVVAVHVSGFHLSGILRNGHGACTCGSGKRGGEILGEELALGVASRAAFRHIVDAALGTDGNVEVGADKRGAVDAVLYIYYRLDGRIHTERLTELFGAVGGHYLGGGGGRLGYDVNHTFEGLVWFCSHFLRGEVRAYISFHADAESGRGDVGCVVALDKRFELFQAIHDVAQAYVGRTGE